ncbi:hypothetical protein EG329_007137 [Mollisiaceae sp. DMI_Dod_QoI]|nr:hypothetical protein EG329_007137 [Helotiales sp. DMI_Dod_QoI]
MAENEPTFPHTFADDLGDELVTIYVGNHGKKYLVHNDLLLSQCHHFQAEVVPGVFGGREEVDWRGEDPAAVALLVSFLYKSKVPTFNKVRRSQNGGSSKEMSKTLNLNPPASTVTTSTATPLLHPARFSYDQADTDVDFSKVNPKIGEAIDALPWSHFDRYSQSFRPASPLGKSSFLSPTSAVSSELAPIKADAKINLYQITLIRLCILAEKISWSKLFNAAIRSYVEGEAMLCQSMLIGDIRLIYEHTHTGSKLREMVLDGFSTIGGRTGVDIGVYTAYAQENAMFMNDVFLKLSSPKHEFDSVLDAARGGAYDLPEKARFRTAGTQLFGSSFCKRRATAPFNAYGCQRYLVEASLESFMMWIRKIYPAETTSAVLSWRHVQYKPAEDGSGARLQFEIPSWVALHGQTVRIDWNQSHT